ncbi:MAG: CPBP family intramembrane metalloprotease [Planctomycetes bacterium]|nr:CPBP family intramembrane metalloprotease [Planctomycetota bacterium]
MRREHFEIAGVLLALLLHFVLTRVVGIRGLDVIPLTLLVLGYALWRGRAAEARAAWGTRAGGLRECFVASGALFAFGAAVCAGIGWQRGHLAVDLHLAITLLLYPLWGIAQQFLVLALFANGLDRLGLPRAAVLAVATLGFGAAHVPNWQLVAATLVLGAWCTVLFFRHRNLWPLGLAHGVLGALFYRWVLGVDVCVAMFTPR